MLDKYDDLGEVKDEEYELCSRVEGRGDGQELDVGEAEPLDVGDQPFRHHAPGERAVAVLQDAQPGAGMHLVDRDRRVETLSAGAIATVTVIAASPL